MVYALLYFAYSLGFATALKFIAFMENFDIHVLSEAFSESF